MNAVEQAQAVKAKLVEMTGGWVSPDNMLVLGPDPVPYKNNEGEDDEMSLETHGWGSWQEWYHVPCAPIGENMTWRDLYDEPPYAELVAEEAHGQLEQACMAVCKKGTWDIVQTAVVCFYGDM